MNEERERENCEKVGGRRKVAALSCGRWEAKNVCFWKRETLVYIGKKITFPKLPQPTFHPLATLLHVPTAQPPENNEVFKGPSLMLYPYTNREWKETKRLHEDFRESCNKETEP